MELRDFVAETFKAIISGVKDAQSFAKQEGAEVNPKIYGLQLSMDRGLARKPTGDGGFLIQVIDFDIAITASDRIDTQTTPEVRVGKLEVAADGENSTESGSISRIKFSIPVSLPYQEP